MLTLAAPAELTAAKAARTNQAMYTSVYEVRAYSTLYILFAIWDGNKMWWWWWCCSSCLAPYWSNTPFLIFWHSDSQRHGRLSLQVYNQLRQLRPLVCSLSMNATKTLVQAFISCPWTTVIHCFMVSVTDFFNAFTRCRTLSLAWLQAPVVVTTSHQCCGSCTGCQFVSESHSRSRGSCISRSLVLLPRILLTTVIFCLTLVDARWGLIPTTSGSCLCHKHTANLATGVSRLPVLDCGTTFHPGFDGRDFPSILLDDPWKHIFLATEAPSDSFDLFALYK